MERRLRAAQTANVAGDRADRAPAKGSTSLTFFALLAADEGYRRGFETPEFRFSLMEIA